jgi:hypothetical protein
MAQQTINVGTTPNDGTGDTLRTAGQKVQANFTELYGTRASLQLTPTAFASLPTPSEGMIASVNNSNTAVWGANIAGGGANKVLAYYNGTNWTVAGK